MFAADGLVSVTALLYYVCSAILLGLALFVFAKAPRLWLHQCFALTALSLLAWVDTLFLYDRALDSRRLLLLGRANFAAVVFTAPLAWMLVHAIAAKRIQRRKLLIGASETIILAALSGLTPLVDRTESGNITGLHSTAFGLLFPIYLLHVVGYLAAAVVSAFRSRRYNTDPSLRDQLLLVGAGMVATGGIAILTNAILPYAFGNFHWIDAGTLSTSLFIMAVAYAIVRHHLFDIRLLVRKTLVYGLLMSIALAAYSSLVLIVTDRLTAGIANVSIRFGVLLIAFSFDPARRFFEHRADRLLFPNNPESLGRDNRRR